MKLSVDKVVTESGWLLKIKGTLDITTNTILELYFQSLEDGIEELIIDFSQLKFIDSTGVGAILNVIHMSQEKNFLLKLQGMDELTDHVFDTIGIYRMLEVVQGEVI